MNITSYDPLKDRDYEKSSSSSSAKGGAITDGDVATFANMLERKTNGDNDVKEKTKEAIYSDKEAKKESEKNAKTASNLPNTAKMSASKQLLYNMPYMNKATLSLAQKSAMGLNADGTSKAMVMYGNNQNMPTGKTGEAVNIQAQSKASEATGIAKTDEAKAGKESKAKSPALGVNANISAQNTEQTEKLITKEVSKAEKTEAERNVKREEVIKQIINHVELKNFAGKSELTIKMNPEFLGAMKMRLIFEGDKVSAEFNTTSKAVREAIADSSDELSQAFNEKGIKVGHIGVKLVDKVS